MLSVEKKPHAALLPAGKAVLLAAVAAVVLQLSAAAAAPEGVAEALWVLGWALAVWSAISAVVAVVLLLARARSGDSALVSVVLVGAAVALLTMTAMLHPFVGTGWAAA